MGGGAGRRLSGPGATAGRLLDLAFPAVCLGCGREGTALCRACGRALAVREGIPAGVRLGMPSDVPLPLVQLEWCAPYGGLVRDALHALKYRGEQRLAQPLGDAVAARWREASIGGDLLVHVPVHPARRAARGYDQAELLARAAAATLGRSAVPALRRDRATAPQYELGRERRAANVAAAFTVVPARRADVAGRWLVLVDDVMTTGATLIACAEALLDAGAAAVSAVTVAREA
ncbi:MAG TPA: phosphoribosyltransferase family protein [Candidatus Nanopelagicales bacterium]|nr:phosphoribosyltransferase family protein [Candidatus Nanopelagicales bacterium]